MKSDLSIQQDVNDELLWEPAVDAASVGVDAARHLMAAQPALVTAVVALYRAATVH